VWLKRQSPFWKCEVLSSNPTSVKERKRDKEGKEGGKKGRKEK
jgi:molybdopterin synthase catalytic subunit